MNPAGPPHQSTGEMLRSALSAARGGPTQPATMTSSESPGLLVSESVQGRRLEPRAGRGGRLAGGSCHPGITQVGPQLLSFPTNPKALPHSLTQSLFPLA